MADTTTTQHELPFQAHDLVAERYEIIRVVGKGGMGMVFQVIDHTLDNDLVALKVIYTHLVQDEIVFARFRNEVLVARKLSHPNIVRLYDFGYAGFGAYYISMEYVEGTSLSSKIYARRDERLSFDEIVHVLHQVSLGMQHAHSKGVVHRDLKPDNILLGLYGEVKITDLGLARTLEIDKGFTNTGETVGTPYYMAPEQIRGAGPDKRSDIYSLGIMAYEMASGRRPFSDDCWFTLAAMHLNQPLPKLPNKDGEIPRWFEDFVQICTAKNPDQRFQSFDEVIDMLEEHLPNFKSRRMPSIFLGTGLRSKASRVRRTESKFWRYASVWGGFAILLLSAITAAFRVSPPLQEIAASSVLRIEQSKGWHLGLARALIGTNVERTSVAYWSYIHEGNSRNLSALLGAGASANETTPEKSSALHEAAIAKQSEIVQVLLQHGANVQARDAYGMTPLMRAISTGDEGIVQTLLKADSPLDAADSTGRLPLMLAAHVGDLRIVSDLVNHGAFINPQDEAGKTALHYAAANGNEEVIRVLLDKNADINRQDKEGNTPLMTAIRASHSGAMRLLLVRGANQRLKDLRGDTAYDLAKDSPELRQILLSPGTNR